MPEGVNTATDNGKAVDKGQEAGGKSPRGRVSITRERCKGCGYCVEFCPLGVLLMSRRFNAKGYHYPERGDEAKCNGCDLCGMYCPDFAICGSRVPRK